jgi:hypothetical protein
MLKLTGEIVGSRSGVTAEGERKGQTWYSVKINDREGAQYIEMFLNAVALPVGCGDPDTWVGLVFEAPVTVYAPRQGGQVKYQVAQGYKAAFTKPGAPAVSPITMARTGS